MSRAGVPQEAQRFQEKWRIALELLAEMKPQLPAYKVILFDAGYGVILPLLVELEKRGEPYLAQVPRNVDTWPKAARATLVPAARGRLRLHAVVRDAAMQPRTMLEWRDHLLAEPQEWTEVRLPRADSGTVRAIALRIQASRRGAARWRLIERLADDTFKYYLSNLPAETPLAELVRLAHQRCAIEQGSQQLKEELGLDHFEGLSWRGLHHHLTLCFLAFCFLTRLRASKKTPVAAWSKRSTCAPVRVATLASPVPASSHFTRPNYLTE